MSENLPRLEVTVDECKGCKLCIEACPKKCITLSSKPNRLGYQYAQYSGSGCTGCGVCFYSCPEPGAVTVFKKPRPAAKG